MLGLVAGAGDVDFVPAFAVELGRTVLPRLLLPHNKIYCAKVASLDHLGRGRTDE